MPREPDLLPRAFLDGLGTAWLGRRVYYLVEVDSTNRLAVQLARAGERHGTMVITDYQRAGRGRGTRRWLSPPGRNLLFSLIFKPERSSRDLLPLTLVFGLSVAETLSDILGEAFTVKWPNDVVTGSRKICGVLAEGSTASRRASFVVVGLGVNVNQSEDEFEGSLVDRATSCLAVVGKRLDRTNLLRLLLGGLESVSQRFFDRGFAPFREPYEARMSTMGTQVAYRRGGKTAKGTVVGVAIDGALRVRTGSEEVVLYNETVRGA